MEHIVRLRKRGIGAESVSFCDIDDLLLVKIYPHGDTFINDTNIVSRPSFVKRCIYSLILRSPYKRVGLMLYDIVIVDRAMSLKCIGFVKSSRLGGIVVMMCDDHATYCKIYSRIQDLMPEVVSFVAPAKLPCTKPVKRRILIVDHPIGWLKRVTLFIYPVGRGVGA